VAAQQRHRLASNALTAAMTHDEKMAQINLPALDAIKRVSGHFAADLEQRRLVRFVQPIFQARFQFRHIHRVAVAFIDDELVIEFRQKPAVALGCQSPRHALWFT
jgi:hypothetical protein